MATLPQGATEAANLSNISLHAELSMPPNATGFPAGGIHLGARTSVSSSSFLTPTTQSKAAMAVGFPAPASSSGTARTPDAAQPRVGDPGAKSADPPGGDEADFIELTAQDVEEIVNDKIWNRR